jgi:hypothetical protein
MNLLTEEQLEKLTTKRLLGVRRALTKRMGFVGARLETNGMEGMFDGDEWAVKEFKEVLQPYDEILRRVMAKREHVNR